MLKPQDGSERGRAPEPEGGGVCARCGRALALGWVEFAPETRATFGEGLAWGYLPCEPECEEEKERQRLEDRSGIPKRLRRCALDNFEPYVGPSAAYACAKVEGYLKDWEANREEGRGLFLCGGTGTGKSHLAAALARELIRSKNVPCLFVPVCDLLEELRGAYTAADAGEAERLVGAPKEAQFLVLDGLGEERATEWTKERVFVLVDHRYREQLPTAFTSHAGPNELMDRYGERTTSRLLEMCDWIALEGPDFRETRARR